MLDDTKTEPLIEGIKNYLHTNYKLIKLQAAERLSVIATGFMMSLFIMMVGTLFLFFISLAIAFYLSACIGNNYAGFLIVALFYLLGCIILIVGRKKIIEKPLRDVIVKTIFTKR